jgi:hypothetical protein
VPEDYWDQVTKPLGRYKNLTHLPHAFVLTIRPFVRNCLGSQDLGAMEGIPSEESLLIDEPWHLYIISTHNWSQSSCLNPQSYILFKDRLCVS